MSKELEKLRGITRNKIEYIKKQPKIDWVYLKYYEDVSNLVDRLESIEKENDKYKRVLDIIKEKNVDISLLKGCEDSYEYNMNFPYREIYHLTQEEFVLLKEMIK